MHRRWTLSSAVMGAATCLLLGSGLIAAVSDSVTSPGNSDTSGTYTPPHNAQAAIIPLADTCTLATFTDGPLAAFVTRAVDLTTGGDGGAQTSICVKNAGFSSAKLTVAFTNVVNTELGPCSPAETTAGDGNCTTAGEPGELSPVMQAGFVECGAAVSCIPTVAATFASFSSLESSTQLVASLTAGTTQRYVLFTRTDPAASDTAKLKAQSDKVQWDLVFTLQDL